MKKYFKCLLAVMMMFTMVACSKNSEDNLVIGSIGPYEGEYSVYGLAVRNGVQMAIDEAGEVLGKKVELVAYDSKGDVMEATNSYFKLVDSDKAVAIVGPTLSGESIAVGEASQDYKTPILSPSATAIDYTLTGDNVFRGAFTDPYQAKAMGEFAATELKAKTAAILYNAGSDYSEGLTENFTKEFEALGGEVVLSEAYASADKDFNTQLTKILEEQPDVLFIPNYYQDNALIASQARNLGIESVFLGGDGWDGVLSVVEDASALEGAIFCNHYSPDDEDIIAWFEAYKEKFDMDATAFAVLGYDSAKLMLQAITEANSEDPQAIVDALNNISYEGLLGGVTFDENGDPIKNLAFITVKDGEYASYK
ncbi:MAG: ABC transporter substrate-binding protein [Anaerorhabdus sp.]